ncbi:MAG: DinB family protein [Flavobacteriales bacterium]
MNEELQIRLTELSKVKDEFLKPLKVWSDDELQWQPAEGWSANQVIEHIMSAEMGTLGYMKKKSSSGWDTLEVTGEEHIKNSIAVNTRLASHERYKAPSVLPEPTGHFTFAQMTTHWGRLRKEMEEFFATVNPEHYDRLVFRQPAAGMLNVLQAIEFMFNHIRHHMAQIERIKAGQGI